MGATPPRCWVSFLDRLYQAGPGGPSAQLQPGPARLRGLLLHAADRTSFPRNHGTDRWSCGWAARSLTWGPQGLPLSYPKRAWKAVLPFLPRRSAVNKALNRRLGGGQEPCRKSPPECRQPLGCGGTRAADSTQ